MKGFAAKPAGRDRVGFAGMVHYIPKLSCGIGAAFGGFVVCPRNSPANCTASLPARKVRICSRLVASESPMLFINPLHPVPRLQAHLA